MTVGAPRPGAPAAGGGPTAGGLAQPLPRRWRRPAVVSLGGKALELGTLVPLLTVVPRTLGPADYGALALALAIVTAGSTAAALGGPTLLTRFVAAVRPSERPALALALTLRAARWRLALGLSALAAGGAAFALAPGSVPLVPALLVAGAFVLDVAATLLLQAALALGGVASWSLRYPLQNGALVVAALGLHQSFGRDGAVAALPIASGVALVLGAASLAPRLRGVSRIRVLPGGVARFALLQGAGGALLALTHRGGVVAVALLGGSAAQQGFAGLALGLALALTYVVGQIFTVELPGLAAHAATDLARVERSVGRAAARLAAAAGIAAAFGVVLAEPLLRTVVGRDYSPASDAVGIVLAGVVLAPVVAAASQLTALRLRPDLRLLASGAGAAVFLAATALLVPAHAATGAAAAFVLAAGASVLVSGAVLRPALGPGLVAGSLGAALTLVLLAVSQ